MVALALLAAGVGLALPRLSYNLQIYLVLLVATALAAAWLLPRATRIEPTVTVPLLTLALVVKIVASLARYVVLQVVYGGGDAIAYHEAGVASYQDVRAFDFGFIQPPYFETSFVEDAVPFLYAVIGPSILGGFLIFSLLAFLGSWLLYRAHRISFPDGDSKLYFFVLFFLPTMVFWPASLGKDALTLFGLGLAFYGLARLLRRFTGGAAVQFLIGLGLTFAIRTAVGVIVLAATAVALMIRPGNLRSPFTRPITWVILLPPIVLGLVAAAGVAGDYLNVEEASVDALVDKYETTSTSLFEEGGSSFEAADPTSPTSVLTGVSTVLFRPFPWELGDPQAVLAGMESLFLIGLVLFCLPRIGRALALWRGGMVPAAIVFTVTLILPLTAVSNFGLLVRQRAQLLSILFLFLTAVKRRPRVAVPYRSPPVVRPAHAAATPG
jgi:hypothetical protein